jgi:hypothetical protein
MAEHTGYEQTTIAEIREILRDNGYGEEFLSQSKSVLVNELLTLQSLQSPQTDEPIMEDIFDNLQEEGNDMVVASGVETTTIPYTQLLPVYGSPDWHGYVMSQFTNEELIGGAPTCDGCRRVVEEVVGPIVSSYIRYNDPPSINNNGTATVAVGITILVSNEDHPLYKQEITCEDIADVNRDNCDAPYYKHASATASTRAEGRVLRKLLRLHNIITAEETSITAESFNEDCDWHTSSPITDSQINVIDLLCKRLDIDVVSFINSGSKTYDNISLVTQKTASDMIQELNKIQRGIKQKSASVGSYNNNWKV